MRKSLRPKERTSLSSRFPSSGQAARHRLAHRRHRGGGDPALRHTLPGAAFHTATASTRAEARPGPALGQQGRRGAHLPAHVGDHGRTQRTRGHQQHRHTRRPIVRAGGGSRYAHRHHHRHQRRRTRQALAGRLQLRLAARLPQRRRAGAPSWAARSRTSSRWPPA